MAVAKGSRYTIALTCCVLWTCLCSGWFIIAGHVRGKVNELTSIVMNIEGLS